MAEKRGETVKLIDNYNTAGVLEVKMGDTWYRTTSRDFRSFDGPRRITEPTAVNEVEPENTGKIVQSEVWEAARIRSESRGT